MENKLALNSLRNILIAVAYIFIVAQVMRYGEKLFGNLSNSIVGPFAFLLLFVLSAAVVGGLVFGQSIYLFFENKKKESLKSAFYSIDWLLIVIVIVFVFLYLFKT